MRWRTLASCTLALTCWMSPVLATPTAPEGWTVSSAGKVQIYRKTQNSEALELRLFPAETTTDSLQAWFQSHVSRPPAGVMGASFGQPDLLRSGVIVMTGQGVTDGDRKVSVIRMGCKDLSGAAVYGEVVSSPDAAFFQSQFPLAAGVMASACIRSDTAAPSTPAKAAPDAKKVATAASENPANTAYPYVKAQGTGLRQSDVEIVLKTWEQQQYGMSLRVVSSFYLLLKDGSYREGFPPVALEDFDAAASRAGEPQKWGRWKKSGGEYLLAQAQRPNDFSKLPNQSMRYPAKRGERLASTWTGSSAYATLWSVAQSKWGVSFDRDGRFKQYSGGSVVGGVNSAEPGMNVHGSTVRDDDSTTSTVGGTNFGGGSSTKRESTLSDRSGTYSLDGYTLELHYDSGRVVRAPFFTAEDRNSIWFAGGEVSRDDGK